MNRDEEGDQINKSREGKRKSMKMERRKR